MAAASAPSPAAPASGPDSPGISSIGASAQPWQPGAAVGPPVGGTPVVVVTPDQGGSSGSGGDVSSDGEPADRAPAESMRPLLPAEVQASSSLSSASSPTPSNTAATHQGERSEAEGFAVRPLFADAYTGLTIHPRAGMPCGETLPGTAQAAQDPGA